MAESLDACRDLESHATNAYFGGWTATVAIQFAKTDHGKIPEHWRTFASRRSPIMRGRTPRGATTPINALLNYLYALAEVEARTALTRLGLDPGLGVIHVDAKARDSLALDLLEVARPAVDAYALDLVSRRHFRRSDFHETRDGQCRLDPALAEQLAPTLTLWARELAPHAERVAHLIIAATTARPATPLTRAHSRPAPGSPEGDRAASRRSRATAKPPAALMPSCRTCGTELTERRRKLCPACWPVERARLTADRARQGHLSQSEGRRTGHDPSNSTEARAARSAALSSRKREQLEWDRTTTGRPSIDFDTDIRPALRRLPLSRLVEATGLSLSACSRIRSGSLTPHARHWPALQEATRP